MIKEITNNFFTNALNDLINIIKYIPQDLLNFLCILKIKNLQYFFIFNNVFFLFIYLILLIIFVNFSYKLIYNIFHILIFELLPLNYLNIKEFKQFILNYKFEKIFSQYYKLLLKLNIKQYLIGSGLILFLFSIYILFYILINLKLNFNFDKTILITNNTNLIYNILFIKFNFFKLNYIFLIIYIYIIIHIIFGFYNIFYDYLKDSAFILFLLLIINILLIIFFYLLYNLELYYSINYSFFFF